jgi:isoquinoline 1-oxidoreductase subunit beta
MAQQGSHVPNASKALLPSLPKASRRSVLIGVGAVFGLAVGYAVWPRHVRLNLPVRADEILISGWVKIGADGRIVVIVPQAEMGQGVYTSLPMLVAEELGARWEDVSVEPAPLHPLYVNKGMIEEAVMAMPSLLQGAGRWALGEVMERYTVHITGGSTSIKAFHETMRLAGATARDMLRKAAADQWGVNWKKVEAKDGMLHHEGRTLRFAEVAGKARTEDAPDSPVLKTRDAYRIIGKNVPRLDIPAKVRGSAIFGLDVRIPEMAYAALRQGPIGDGRLASYDRAAVTAAAGVLGVVEGDNWLAVVADRYWLARKQIDAMRIDFTDRASEKINIDWARGRLRVALESGEAHVYEREGDPEAGMKASGKTVSAQYEVPYLAHACLEPMNATARVNRDGSVDIWAPVQSITLAAMAVAGALGIETDKVNVTPTFIGGGFGRKAEPDVCIQAALIARQIQRPVQVIWDRPQDFQQDRFRPMALASFSARLSPQGRILALKCRSASQSVMGSTLGRVLPDMANHEPDGASVQGIVKLPYAIQDREVAHVVDIMPIPVGFWRSVGHSQNAFFIEVFMDELARAAGKDPLSFRLMHLEAAPRHARALRTAAEAAGPAVPGRGRGYALHESFGSIAALVADVSVSDGGDLTVHKFTCALDCGDVVHPDTVHGQLEGGIIFGLSAARSGKISFARGVVQESNFDSYALTSLADTPEIVTRIIQSGESLGGVGEVGVPCVAPALSNAIFAATGVRVRTLPIIDQKIASDEMLLRARRTAESSGPVAAEPEAPSLSDEVPDTLDIGKTPAQ